ncbi:MAG: matrixin family metalloprotease [Pseudomonadota bacterium]
MRLAPTTLTLLLLLTAAPCATWSQAVFPFDNGGETGYLKWGDKRPGTPGGTVTWSLIPAGTAGSPFCGTACSGVSQAALQVETAPGAGFEAQTLAQLRPLIVAALDTWAALSGIEFVEVTDAGLPINDAGAEPDATGHIRIGLFNFATGGGGVGYAPPPNGGTGAGDVLLDAGSFYQIAAAAEGVAFDRTFAPNDLPGLLLHELGHAIGLAHPAADGSCPVMQIAEPCPGIVNRAPDASDINSVLFLYQRLFADSFEVP